jgi:hypothetical protein
MNETRLPDRVPGVFSDRAAAEAAVSELRDAGFEEHTIGIAVAEPGRYAMEEDREGDELKGIAHGIGVGAPIGAIAGMLFVSLVVPGATAAIGVGGALIAGGTSGAVWGTFIGAMSGFTAKVKLDDYQDRYCEIPLSGDDLLVVVDAGTRAAAARDVMVARGAKCFMDQTHLA